jgi:hypothetical protein
LPRAIQPQVAGREFKVGGVLSAFYHKPARTKTVGGEKQQGEEGGAGVGNS